MDAAGDRDDRVLVIGGQSHVGQRTLAGLARECTVRVLPLETRHPPPSVPDGVTVADGTLTSVGSLGRAAAGVDLIWVLPAGGRSQRRVAIEGLPSIFRTAAAVDASVVVHATGQMGTIPDAESHHPTANRATVAPRRTELGATALCYGDRTDRPTIVRRHHTVATMGEWETDEESHRGHRWRVLTDVPAVDPTAISSSVESDSVAPLTDQWTESGVYDVVCGSRRALEWFAEAAELPLASAQSGRDRASGRRSATQGAVTDGPLADRLLVRAGCDPTAPLSVVYRVSERPSI